MFIYFLLLNYMKKYNNIIKNVQIVMIKKFEGPKCKFYFKKKTLKE